MKKSSKGKATQNERSCCSIMKNCATEMKKDAVKFIVLLVVLIIVMYGLSGRIITNWINNNPEIMIDSLNKHVMELQKQAQEEQQVRAKEVLPSIKNDIIKDRSFPRTINKNANVTIIQFADYNCGYCKAASKTIHQLIQEDKKIEVIFIELPIFGGLSTEAAKVGLAVNKINPAKYYDFHYNMMSGNAKEESGIYEAVRKSGLDVSEVKRTVERNSADFDNKLAQNRMIAQNLGLNGTPAFIIGDELIPGAIQYEQAVSLVKEARK